MKIKNKKNKSNCVNLKVNGMAKKVFIPAGKTVDIHELNNMAQIININDFKTGFFEVIEEVVEQKAVAPKKKAATKGKKETTKKKKTEDSLDKVKKEVKDYTDNKDNK